jgi:hypothetical protein
MSMRDWSDYRQQPTVQIGCDGSIAVHAESAARLRASREEITETLGSRDRRQRRCIVYSTHVLDACEQVTPRQPA